MKPAPTRARAPQLCHLRPVRLGSQGVREVEDLTPWLATPDGMRALGEALGFNLVSVETEFPIGRDFRADARCVARNGRVVVVEAQLGAADQTHLGKLMVYAFNTDCALVVWLAEAFRSEQLAVLEALNARVGPGPRFAAVEVTAHAVGPDQVALALKAALRPTAVAPPPVALPAALAAQPVSLDPAHEEGPLAQRLFWRALFEVARPELPVSQGIWGEWRGWGTAWAHVQIVLVAAPEALRIGLAGPRATPCVGAFHLSDPQVVEALNAHLPPELQLALMTAKKPATPHVGLKRSWPKKVEAASDLHALAHAAADAAAALLAAVSAAAQALGGSGAKTSSS